MFMQQVKLNNINEQIKEVNRQKMKYQCYSVLKTTPKLLLVDADLCKEICYSSVEMNITGGKSTGCKLQQHNFVPLKI